MVKRAVSRGHIENGMLNLWLEYLGSHSYGDYDLARRETPIAEGP